MPTIPKVLRMFAAGGVGSLMMRGPCSRNADSHPDKLIIKSAPSESGHNERSQKFLVMRRISRMLIFSAGLSMFFSVRVILRIRKGHGQFPR